MSREFVTLVRHSVFVVVSLVWGLLACDGRIVSRVGGSPEAEVPAARPPPPRVTRAPAQLRLLSGAEYRATVKDLLGVEASSSLTHADWSSGFDTGAGTQLQEALFATLVQEAEAVSAAAMTQLPSAFPCLLAATVDDACVRTLIGQLGRRAHRRPLEPAQADAVFAAFRSASQLTGSRREGVQHVVARLLLSPQFLYRAEVGQPTAGGARQLDAFERASFLSYVLTGSMPDEALLADAEAGRLDDAVARLHVRRLWQTPRARARVAALFRQWLKLGALDDMVARPQDFPKLSAPAQGLALRDGFDAFVTSVLFEGAGTLRATFDEPMVMVNQHTASLVGAQVEGDALRRVEVPRAERRGLLTQPGLLAALGASGDVLRDRPVMRGFTIKTQLLCEPIGPPSGINTAVAASTAASIPGFDELTTRQQYEAMMEQGAACSACHAQFMPLGFAFGRYDALGRYRTTLRQRTVDPSARGVPVLGEVRDFTDGLELSDVLAGHEAVAGCFTKHLVAFALGLGTAEPVSTLAASLDHSRAGAPLHVGETVEALLLHPSWAERIVQESPQGGGAGGGSAGGGSAGGGAAGGAAGGSSAPTAQVLLSSGEELRPNQSKQAFGGTFTFVYQGDGNLVLYRMGRALWSSGTAGQTAYLVAMQGDGNLVVYARPGAPVFNTQTNGNAGARLFLEPTGRLVIRAIDGRELVSAMPAGATP
jgi:hypothetical protein